MIWVLMPTTSPWRFRSGPPEFPGFVAASCCTTRGTEKLLSVGLMVLPTALMMPEVMENPRENGSPMATANCPGLMASLSPRAIAGGRTASSVILITARSESGSSPTSSASTWLPSLSMTIIRSAPSITCLLVTMCPSSSQTKPDPAARDRKSLCGIPGAAPPMVIDFSTRNPTTDGTVRS